MAAQAFAPLVPRWVIGVSLAIMPNKTITSADTAASLVEAHRQYLIATSISVTIGVMASSHHHCHKPYCQRTSSPSVRRRPRRSCISTCLCVTHGGERRAYFVSATFAAADATVGAAARTLPFPHFVPIFALFLSRARTRRHTTYTWTDTKTKPLSFLHSLSSQRS